MKTYAWFTALVALGFGLSVSAAVPKPPKPEKPETPAKPKADKPDKPDKPDKNGKSETQEVKLADVPDAARKVIEEEKGTDKINEILEVKRANAHYYKANIEKGKRDTVVVVSAKGKLMGVWHVGPEATAKELQYEDLPEGLKAMVHKEYGKKAVRFLEYTRAERKVYAVKVKGEGWHEFNGKGEPIEKPEIGVLKGADDDTVKREMDFEKLPGQVKAVVGKEIGGHRVERVFQVMEKGELTRYWVQAVDGKTMTVGIDGKVIKPLGYPEK